MRMQINQKQKDFMTMSAFGIAGVVFFIVGMFFFRSEPGTLGYLFQGTLGSKGLSLSRILGILGFFIALLIGILALQTSSHISDRKKKSGGRW